MAKSRTNQDQEPPKGKKSRRLGSTTSLGKRRSLGSKQQQQQQSPSANGNQSTGGRSRDMGAASGQQQQQQADTGSTMSNPKSSEYGSQASPMRVPAQSREIVKVAILGAAGGIGQPLALLLMLHSEYIQHLALYDLVDSIHGIGLDLSHIDRQVRVTTHLGPDELADAVRGARVIVVPAGLAQKPGMSRDDLFGSNAKIMYNLAKVCAQVAPDAMLAIITNPVNSLVPMVCEIYTRLCGNKTHHSQHQHQQQTTLKEGSKMEQTLNKSQQQQDTKSLAEQQKQAQQPGAGPASTKSLRSDGAGGKQPCHVFEDCCRRVFGVTTLDVIRASTLMAKSAFFKSEPNGMFKDPGKVQVPVLGGHAGKTIMPILSQATPKLDKKRLQEDRATTLTVVDSIQQAGIEVLNAKKGKGSATLAMAYAACRFTISLLRAANGEQNIVECAYVRHPEPCFADLEYFATPLLLGKQGYVKSMGVGKLLPAEQQMLDEGARELRLSIVKGEDFAREQLSSER